MSSFRYSFAVTFFVGVHSFEKLIQHRETNETNTHEITKQFVIADRYRQRFRYLSLNLPFALTRTQLIQANLLQNSLSHTECKKCVVFFFSSLVCTSKCGDVWPVESLLSNCFRLVYRVLSRLTGSKIYGICDECTAHTAVYFPHIRLDGVHVSSWRVAFRVTVKEFERVLLRTTRNASNIFLSASS